MKLPDLSELEETVSFKETCIYCGGVRNARDHGTWIGFHCNHCGNGGYRFKNKKEEVQVVVPKKFSKKEYPMEKAMETSLRRSGRLIELDETEI